MDLPIIVARGMRPNGEVTGSGSRQAVTTLPKPYTANEVLTTVAKILRPCNKSRQRADGDSA